MPESGIGAQAAIALGAFPGFVYPADVEPSSRWYEPERDPVEITMDKDGLIEVPRAAGIGAMIDRERYEAFTRPIEHA
jgi:L-alanine-DL-glutamate epimerase-like enolase superfamily enzyme